MQLSVPFKPIVLVIDRQWQMLTLCHWSGRAWMDWAGFLILNVIFTKVLNAGCYVMAAHSNGYGLRSCTAFRLVRVRNWPSHLCSFKPFMTLENFNFLLHNLEVLLLILLKVRTIQISVFCNSANFCNCILNISSCGWFVWSGNRLIGTKPLIV